MVLFVEEQQKTNTAAPECPVGHDDCDLIAEVTRLKRELADLSTQVRTDPLTGLANYRHFLATLAQEMERTQRSGQPTSLIMLDIDHFKRVNDTWGHEIGNQALVHIAGLMVQSLRKLDIPCRYGGEEFAVILPDTTLRAAAPVAERLRELIEKSPLPLAGQELRITASLGISTYLMSSPESPEELVQQADDFLYQAKQDGRNRVRHAELPSTDEVSQEEKDTLSQLFSLNRNNRTSS